MKMKFAAWSGVLILVAAANVSLAAGPTDPQIAAIVVTANQVDIDAGKLAVSKAQSKDVKEFAQLMITDHSGVNKSATELVTKLHVTPQSNPTSQSLQKGGDDNMAALTQLSGSVFDRAYVDHEVAYHQAVLDAVDATLIPSAQNAELKGLLETGLKIFQGHEKHAEDVAKSLN